MSGIPSPFEARRDSVRAHLAASLTWSPHDYIRAPAAFFARDRARSAAHMTRALPPGDDLRFVLSTPGGRCAVLAERLPWDSAFFGYGVARLHGIFALEDALERETMEAAIRPLLELCGAHDVRYLFSVVPAEANALAQALTSAGFALIETRLHYHRELEDFRAAERFPVRLAEPADLPDLRHTARTTVNPYDRFHADPSIAPADADRLMEAWMDASVNTRYADGVLVPRDGPASALCTLKFHRDAWEAWGYRLAQLPFGAVSAQRRGWYTRLFSEAMHLLKEGGAQHVYYVTQATNRAAIRVCEKLGLRYGRTEHVFRKVLR